MAELVGAATVLISGPALEENAPRLTSHSTRSAEEFAAGVDAEFADQVSGARLMVAGDGFRTRADAI